MPRTFDDARRWARLGTGLLVGAADLDDAGLDAPSALPGWTRKHVVAHVAANADALSNLVHWAATGEPTPMYASPEERAAGIECGARMPAAELTAWLRRSADALEEGMAALGDEQWKSSVVTAQGRTVPATELPWMRSREVCVHAVDLAAGPSFADLPADFLAALCDDVVGKRGAAPGPALTLEATDTGDRWELPGEGDPVALAGELHRITAYLTGRDGGPTAPDGGPAPALAAWL
ncbi:maleylpyruvate isomerase family mycothiol-dependent enzyme [Streptomyces sp. SCUT-3]|uniref:maleylpyruvate isomerase family mycothiol-dependent enzyme n=1 Tax=Streptomyces sp. SCUT-3 TaxID=2684469 RepID=UPI000CC2FADD|nr:maleylpyruvate isomerase family mycothiol-dependent enzyme [Streptomyces sp. SCUT-3]PLW72050.1 maleylpyruvate isomerase [Streptomyces sp. DJ]QMV20662.1 maleylpyruvate isomerase family mycothiol-dependent enzyme [Streptomyces sp. SCUT-3]